MYRGSSWDSSSSFRSQAGNYVYEGCNAYLGVVGSVDTAHSTLDIQSSIKYICLKKTQLPFWSNTIGRGFRLTEDSTSRETLPFSSPFTEGDQREPATSTRPHSMPAAEPSSEILVVSFHRLDCLLFLFALSLLRDLRQVPCPLWASVSLSVTHGSWT